MLTKHFCAPGRAEGADAGVVMAEVEVSEVRIVEGVRDHRILLDQEFHVNDALRGSRHLGDIGSEDVGIAQAERVGRDSEVQHRRGGVVAGADVIDLDEFGRIIVLHVRGGATQSGRTDPEHRHGCGDENRRDCLCQFHGACCWFLRTYKAGGLFLILTYFFKKSNIIHTSCVKYLNINFIMLNYPS